jgi:hypothetical protein
MARPHYVEAWASELPDTAAEDGRTRAELLLAKLLDGTAAPDALLHSLLDTCGASCKTLPPDARLRSWCSRLQRQMTKPR